MSLFNEHQREYMQGLTKFHPKRKCWCGWYQLGQCHTCPPDKTNADKMAAMCPDCHNEPTRYGAGPIVHRLGCPRNEQKEKQP